MPKSVEDPSLRAIFRRPFAEQVAFFRGKLGRLMPSRTWRDVWREAHDRAFMVAGAAKADLLADLAAAVEKAIADGESLEQFRSRFRSIVAQHGWHGWTGEDSPAGRAWRTRVIYRTNAAASYAAGRLAQLQAFPVWVYRHGGSRDPRPEHLAWDGLTLPSDHPFWQTHYPPNGWGCSCYVVGATSEDEARLLGGRPEKPLPRDWDVRDGRGRLPGVDEGWDYAPGATSESFLQNKVEKLPPALATALSIDLQRYSRLSPDQATLDELIDSGNTFLKSLLGRVIPDDRQLMPLIRLRGQRLTETIIQDYAWALPKLFRHWVLEAGKAIRPFGGTLNVASRRARSLAARIAAKLPADWVAAMNNLPPVRVMISSKRGFFQMKYDRGIWRPFIRTSTGSTAEHEWIHLLQRADPKLDAIFQALHRRRTASEDLIMIGKGEWGRRDQYVTEYVGREYVRSRKPASYDQGPAHEVMTMVYQALLGEDELADELLIGFLTKDRELLALAIGALLRYKP
ncbi:MAG: hypothetical protein KatS3mg125_1388 [Lysobacterales bacterium]|nr:MAG: hypothetical protein KatS3mg125_1388 [Xanthomonadales bacterium]